MTSPDMSNHRNLAISVVINNYNYAPFLPVALDSAIEQLEDCDEIVVVDDGSTDESGEILLRYGEHPQVHVIVQKNQLQLRAVLNGLEAARGDLHVLLDSDDYLLRGYLHRLRILASKYPKVDFFFSDPDFGDQPPPKNARAHRVPEAASLPEGPTGFTRWSVWATGEFVGTPTSGLALRKDLTADILSLRERLTDHKPLGNKTARFLGLRDDSHTAKRFSADGIIVRASSLLGNEKYHCATPAFFYRVHGSNAYAGLGKWPRTYLGIRRGREITRMISQALGESKKPGIGDVLDEARKRSLPSGLKGRMKLFIRYQSAALKSRSPWWRRFLALPKIALWLLPPPTTR